MHCQLRWPGTTRRVDPGRMPPGSNGPTGHMPAAAFAASIASNVSASPKGSAPSANVARVAANPARRCRSTHSRSLHPRRMGAQAGVATAFAWRCGRLAAPTAHIDVEHVYQR